MSINSYVLTETEIACGVTLEQVAAELPRCVIRRAGTVIVSGALSPALAGSVARAALGAPVELDGLSLLGRVYSIAGA